MARLRYASKGLPCWREVSLTLSKRSVRRSPFPLWEPNEVFLQSTAGRSARSAALLVGSTRGKSSGRGTVKQSGTPVIGAIVAVGALVALLVFGRSLAGELLVAEPFVTVNYATGIDMQTGRPNYVPENTPKEGMTAENVCPASIGGKDQQPAAYSPRTRTFYAGTSNACMDYQAVETSYIAGTPYIGAVVKMAPGPGGHRGEFIAWDAAQGKKLWGIKEEWPVWSGALATAGDVVFYGTMDGWFKAIDARDGHELWKFKLGSGSVGNPIAYRGPDGKQYIAVYAGVGGWTGAIVPGGLTTKEPYAGLGVTGLMADLPKHTNAGGMLYVFVLTQKRRLPLAHSPSSRISRSTFFRLMRTPSARSAA